MAKKYEISSRTLLRVCISSIIIDMKDEINSYMKDEINSYPHTCY